MQKLTLELLYDILLEAEFLADQVTQTTFTTFVQDEVKKRAFVRSLEIIVLFFYIDSQLGTASQPS